MQVPLAPGARPPDATLWLRAADGVRLRGGLWRGGDRGLALLLTGRTEFLEKAAIPAGALVERGFSVASLDWRGQGLSDRLLPDPRRGHVGDFDEYGQDLAALLAHPEVAALRPVRLVLAHSMGGPVALAASRSGALGRVPIVLSAPMLGVAFGPAMRVAAWAMSGGAALLGRLDRWPPFGEMATPYVLSDTASAEDNLLTGDAAVFDWMVEALRADPRLALAMPTLGWFRAALAAMAAEAASGAVPVPGLMLWGTREAVVDIAALRAGAARLGLERAEVADGRHELLIEAGPVRAEAWAAIDAFLGRTL